MSSLLPTPRQARLARSSWWKPSVTRGRRERQLEAAVESLEKRVLLSALLPAQPVDFEVPTEIALPTTARPVGPVVLLDVNNDGAKDIVYLGSSGSANNINTLLNNGDGTFKAPVSTAIPGTSGKNNYYDMEVANLNGDGQPADNVLIVLETPKTNNGTPEPGTINIFTPKSDGTVQTPALATITGVVANGPALLGAYSFAVGHLYGASRPADIVVADKYNRTVSIIVGNGNGVFRPTIKTLGVGYLPEAVAIADVNGDGFPDIVVGNAGDNSASVLLNNGDGTFAPQVVIANVPGVGNTRFTTAYISGTYFTGTTEPVPDIITASDTLVDLTMRGAGNPVKFSIVPTVGATNVAPVVIGGDGNDALKNYYSTSTVQVAAGNRSGSFAAAGVYSTVAQSVTFNTSGVTANIASNAILGYGPVGITAGYLVKAGQVDTSRYSPDLVVVDHGFTTAGISSTSQAYTPAITIFRSTGNNQFAGEKLSQVGLEVDPKGYPNNGPTTNNYPNSLVVANLAGDGAPLLGVVEVNYGTAPKKTALSNGAGYTYTASKYPGSIDVLVNQGDGHFSEEVIPDIYGPDGAAVGDINGDGIPDLVVTERYTGKLAIFDGLGNGVFDASPVSHNYYAGNRPQSIAIADLGGSGDVTGDGKPINSIIVGNYGTPYSSNSKPGTTGGIAVFVNSGYGTFSGPLQTPSVYGPSSLVVLDLDGDGIPDVAFTTKLNVEEGVPQAPLAPATPNGAGVVGTGGNKVYIGFGNGDGTFNLLTPSLELDDYPVGNGPSAIISANLDGNYSPPDLVVLNESVDSISVLTNQPDNPGTFNSQKVYNFKFPAGSGGKPNPLDASPVSIAAGDINGDGLADIVVTYSGSSTDPGTQVAILLNLGYSQNNYLSQTPILVPVSNIQLDNNNSKVVHTIPVAVGVADVNGDNRPDIIALESNGGNNSKYAGEVAVLLQGAPLVGPTITSANHTTFASGTTSTFTVTSTGAPAATFTENGALPVGVKFLSRGNGTATISGDPGPTAGGKYVFTINATNGYAPNGSQTFTLTVNQSPTISSVNHTTFTAGTAGTFTVTTTGFPTDAITETGALPTGVTFVDNHNGKATLAGTPAVGTLGTYHFTIGATNGLLPNASQSFTLTVDQAPLITSANNVTFSTGTAASPFTITTVGLPTAALTESGTLPTGVTFADNGNGTASLAGTPAAGTGGVYDISVTANNGITPNASQSFTLTILQSPGISSVNHATFAVGVSNTFTVTTAGFPGDSISETGALPGGVTFTDNGDGTATLAGTPLAGSAGVYPLVLSAANGVGANASENFTLTVDQAPAITSGASATFIAGASGPAFTITTTAVPTAALTESGFLPGGLTFTDNGNGTATLTGTPNARSGGIYHPTFTAGNGISPDAQQTFTLTIDEAPQIISAATVSFNQGVTSSFLFNTTGFPTPTLSESGALPSGITFADNGDGTATLSGTAAGGTAGKYRVTISASNNIGVAASETFKLIINPAQAPSFTSPATATFLAGSGNNFTFSTTGVPTAAISEAGALPSGVTFRDNGDGTALLSGVPSVGSGGKYKFTVTAANGNEPNAVETFKLFVDESPIITSGTGTTFGVGAFGTFTVTSFAYPVAQMVETGTLPSGVSFVDNGDGTATLSGTPATGTAGVYPLMLKAKNGFVPNGKEAFTLTVQGPPAISSVPQVTFTVGTAGSFTIVTAGFPTPSITESGSLPGGLTFQANGDGTATISGTPAPLTGGVYTLSLGAINGIGPFASQTLTIIVDQAPQFTSTSQTTFSQGSSSTFTVDTSAYPTPGLVLVGTLPPGVGFTDNRNGTGTISGTPGGPAGTYNVTIKANNGIRPKAVQTFSLVVGPQAIPAALREQSTLLSSTSADTLVGGAADAAILDCSMDLLGGA